MDDIKCFSLPNNFDVVHYPNTANYIRLHGCKSCMSKWDLKSPYKSCEDVYRECLNRGVSWKELLKFKGYDKNIIL